MFSCRFCFRLVASYSLVAWNDRNSQRAILLVTSYYFIFGLIFDFLRWKTETEPHREWVSECVWLIGTKRRDCFALRQCFFRTPPYAFAHSYCLGFLYFFLPSNVPIHLHSHFLHRDFYLCNKFSIRVSVSENPWITLYYDFWCRQSFSDYFPTIYRHFVHYIQPMCVYVCLCLCQLFKCTRTKWFSCLPSNNG